jgi:DNA-binding MarR family transcriptional regulator
MIEETSSQTLTAHLIHRAAVVARREFERHLGASAITAPQAFVLLAVAARDNANLMTLAADTGIDRSTMSDIVRRLVKRGLLTRQRSREDTRAVLVQLTEVGAQALLEIRQALHRSDAAVLAIVPADQHTNFPAILDRLCANGRAEEG